MLFAFLLAAVPAIVGVLRLLPLAYGAYVLAALALPLSYPVAPQPLMSLPRFLVVLFPLSMWLAAWLAARPRARLPVLAVSAALMAFFVGPVRDLALGGVSMEDVSLRRSTDSTPEPAESLPGTPGEFSTGWPVELRPRGRTLRRAGDLAATGVARHDWPPWTAPAALVGALVLAAVGGLIVDIPAPLLGREDHSLAHPARARDRRHGGAGRRVRAGGRAASRRSAGASCARGSSACARPRMGWRAATRADRARCSSRSSCSASIWSAVFHPDKEKLLEQLGTNEGTALLLLSAALTCVVAPICEEFLFRGYIFTALRNWTGTWPAAIDHGPAVRRGAPGSAPALDLVPLAGLGFGLCLLYRYTGSLYPCIAAHSLNNSTRVRQPGELGAGRSWC